MPPNDRTNTTYNDYETPAEVSLATNPLYRTHEGEHHGDFSGVSIRVTKSTILYAFCAAMNSCNLGYDIGVSTNAGQLIQNDFGLTDTQREIFVGSLNFFSIFGSAFSHWISDRFGRRRSFQVAALTFIVGLVIMSFSKNFTVLMVGRAILGLAVGFGLAIDPYVSSVLHSFELIHVRSSIFIQKIVGSYTNNGGIVFKPSNSFF
jgi:MFS family permease